ncbi:MAG TPA: RnfABCDGE type electron transport complex subunit B [Ruminiclostridium sp.]
MDLIIPVSIIGGLGIIFGLGLAFASKKFEVKVDERVAKIREVLPGANCGACGQTGCDGFSEGIVAGKCSVSGCPIGGKQVAALIAQIIGADAGTMEEKTARVMCNGTDSSCANKFRYSGISDCTAAANLYGGPSACSYGCLGMGNCVTVCGFGAIVVENGVAKVIQEKCTSCGKCIKACPKKIIEMVPVCNEYSVSCKSLDKGNIVRINCSVGCIGCGKCTKVCTVNAIKLSGSLAEIIPELCMNCGECTKVCPTGSITRKNLSLCKKTGELK